MKSNIRLFIIGSLIILGIVTGWMIPASVGVSGVGEEFLNEHDQQTTRVPS